MKKKKILLAEANPLVLKHLESSLVNTEYEITSTIDGADVIKHLQAEDPDLIVMDLILPKFDGWQILKLLKSLKNDNIPVLIISGQNLNKKER